jgi:hypothetical protein
LAPRLVVLNECAACVWPVPCWCWCFCVRRSGLILAADSCLAFWSLSAALSTRLARAKPNRSQRRPAVLPKDAGRLQRRKVRSSLLLPRVSLSVACPVLVAARLRLLLPRLIGFVAGLPAAGSALLLLTRVARALLLLCLCVSAGKPKRPRSPTPRRTKGRTSRSCCTGCVFVCSRRAWFARCVVPSCGASRCASCRRLHALVVFLCRCRLL